MRARRVEAPLQDVSLNAVGAGDAAILPALYVRADVDQKGTARTASFASWGESRSKLSRASRRSSSTDFGYSLIAAKVWRTRGTGAAHVGVWYKASSWGLTGHICDC